MSMVPVEGVSPLVISREKIAPWRCEGLIFSWRTIIPLILCHFLCWPLYTLMVINSLGAVESAARLADQAAFLVNIIFFGLITIDGKCFLSLAMRWRRSAGVAPQFDWFGN